MATFKSELPMLHWSRVVGFARRVAGRLGLAETWTNVALLHLITDRRLIGEPFIHHYVTLRRSSLGKKDVVIVSTAPELARNHGFYDRWVNAWLDGGVTDEFMRQAEQQFTESDLKARMLWGQIVTDGRVVIV